MAEASAVHINQLLFSATSSLSLW